MKTVITMTSWVKRIEYVSYAIFRFMSTQTVKPDLFYLWLAEEEFPRKALDLPIPLLKTLAYYNIKLCWTRTNEYCFKRWYTALQHYHDIIISIDDDVHYDHNLIERAHTYASKFSNIVINIGTPVYKPLSFNNSINRVLCSPNTTTPLYNMQLCGQCIFLPNTFPLEIINESHICKLRRIYCKKCDECGITPLLVKHHIPILTPVWDNIIDKPLQTSAISNDMKNIKNLQLYIAIRVFDDCMNPWKSLYPSYNTEYYDKLPVDTLLTLI